MVQGQDSNYRWGEEALGKDGPSGLVKKFDVLNPNMRARCMASRVRRGTAIDELTRSLVGCPDLAATSIDLHLWANPDPPSVAHIITDS